MSKDNFLLGAVSRLWSPPSKRKSKSIKAKIKTLSPKKTLVGVFEDLDMGKSNKFDYTNRTNSGAKLGQIIGGALQKEAEKVKKDADRHSQKTRKQSTDSNTALADNASINHIIDLKAPNKDLGDEGVCALADGLEAALKNGNRDAYLALEDLNLAANNITTVSLARLAPIINLSTCELKTLNVADNKIKVETDEQAAQWEWFLRAFRGCYKLRRLDLSSNPDLGTRALEIFARVHVSEPLIDSIPPGGDTSVQTLDLQGYDAETSQTHGLGIITDDDSSEVSPAMTNGRIIRRRRGLRSIPYVTLHDVGLDDAGALWLSYILEDHLYPTQLIDGLNATNAESLIKTYQQETNSGGVDWSNNKTLSKESTQLLNKAEAVRQQLLFDDRATVASRNPDEEDLEKVEGEQSRKDSLDTRSIRQVPGGRRVSIRSIRTEDGGEHEATELESARRKFQRHIIAHDGASSVELWNAALKVFTTSRLIMYIAPNTRRYYKGEPRFKVPLPDIPEVVTVQPPSPTDSPTSTSPPQLPLEIVKSESIAAAERASYASKLTATSNGAAGHPETVLTDVTNTPGTPLRLQRPTHRKGAFGEGADLQTVTHKLNVMIVRESDPDRYVRYQRRRITELDADGRTFRHNAVRGHLPTTVIEHIVSFVTTKREMGVLSEVQMLAAVERGQERNTLMAEREWLRKDESAQVWMLLDSIKCLAYGE